MYLKLEIFDIHFYCICQSYKKKSVLTRDLSSGHTLQVANGISYTTLDENTFFSSMHSTIYSSKHHKMAPLALQG